MIAFGRPGHLAYVRPTSSLIAHVRRGDRDARRELFELATPRVLAWCTHLGGPRVDAEDAAHDVLLRAMTALDRLEHPESFDAWLYGITRRVLAAHRRRAWIRRWLPGAVPDAPDPAKGPDGLAELADERAAVHRILDDLPEELREVLVLCDMEGNPDPTVAELLGIPTGTVKSRLRRARERFEAAVRRDSTLCPPSPLHVRGER